jgi:hypothetical protein
LISFSVALNPGSPVISSAFFSFANAAAKVVRHQNGSMNLSVARASGLRVDRASMPGVDRRRDAVRTRRRDACATAWGVLVQTARHLVAYNDWPAPPRETTRTEGNSDKIASGRRERKNFYFGSLCFGL